MRLCKDCGITKPTTEFYKARYYAAYCKPCRNIRYRKYRAQNIERYRAYARQWHKDNPLKIRLYRHGITVHEINDLMAEQDGRCGICKVEFSDKVEYHIDHSHKTGKIRGLLCERCNLAIGLFHEDPERMRRAAMFLRGNYSVGL